MSFPWGKLISAGISAYGQYQQGESAMENAGHQAGILRGNASTALDQAAEDERRFRIFARRRTGTSRANIGASGITGSGSAADVLADTARNLEADAISIRHQGEIRAQGLRDQAESAIRGGKQSMRDARYGAASSLLTGFSEYQAGQPRESTTDYSTSSSSMQRTAGYSAPDDGYRGN